MAGNEMKQPQSAGPELGWIAQIPRLAQRQDSTSQQLEDLAAVANRLGMYDAADAIKRMLEGPPQESLADRLRARAERMSSEPTETTNHDRDTVFALNAAADALDDNAEGLPEKHPRDEPLFAERAPEAAARQLATVLAWLAECELATLERMEGRKSTSKYDLRRQGDIAERAVHQCLDLRVPPRGMLGRKCERLRLAMQAKLRGDHYLWLKRHLGAFLKLATGDSAVASGAASLISAHGDKGYCYRTAWDAAGIPFAHGMALLMLAFVQHRDELTRGDAWVIEQYPNFQSTLEVIDGLDD